MAGAAAGGIVFTLLVPAAVLGWGKNLHFVHNWFQIMALGASPQAQTSQLWAQLLDPYAHDNQSFYAVALRLWGPSAEQLQPGADAALRLWVRAAGLLLLGVLSGVSFYRKQLKIERGIFLEYALFPMAMLYLSPVSEAHHYTVVYLPVLAALWLLEEPEASKGGRIFLEGVLWFAALAVFLGLVFHPLNHAGAYVWGTLALWLGLLVHHGLELKVIAGMERQQAVSGVL